MVVVVVGASFLLPPVRNPLLTNPLHQPSHHHHQHALGPKQCLTLKMPALCHAISGKV